jgi:hypothetical protein
LYVFAYYECCREDTCVVTRFFEGVIVNGAIDLIIFCLYDE